MGGRLPGALRHQTVPGSFTALGAPVPPQMLTSYGQKYIQEMRARLPQGVKVDRIIDKMLRNLWNVGHIHMMLPHSCIIHAVRCPSA